MNKRQVRTSFGALAQLGERLICIQEVRSSILLGSTKSSVFLDQSDQQAVYELFAHPIG